MNKNLTIVAIIMVLSIGVLGFMYFRRGSSRNNNYQSLSFDQSQLVGTKQEVVSQLDSNGYPVIVVEAGQPVRWVINATADQINSCNERFNIPALGLSVTLVPGENVIEFTPSTSGVIDYQCWMGMIRSQIVVVDNLKDFKGLENSNFNSQPGCH